MPLTVEERNRLKEDVSEAVADGLRKALEDPKFWALAVAGMQREATAATGNWAVSMLMKGLSKAFWFIVVLTAVYSVGGWPALTKMFILLMGKP